MYKCIIGMLEVCLHTSCGLYIGQQFALDVSYQASSHLSYPLMEVYMQNTGDYC